MRLVLGAAAALMMLAGVALAQTETPAPAPAVTAASQCAALTPAPTPPDGATASIDDINAFNTAYQAWGETATAALQCRRAEVTQAQATAQSLLEQHNAMAQQINALTTTWQTESAEFCARRGTRCAQQ